MDICISAMVLLRLFLVTRRWDTGDSNINMVEPFIFIVSVIKFVLSRHIFPVFVQYAPGITHSGV